MKILCMWTLHNKNSNNETMYKFYVIKKDVNEWNLIL